MPRQNSRKTANILHEVGRALYGNIWQSELARDLGCTDRTVRKWNAGDAPIPEYLRGEVAKICRRRGDRLIEIAEQLGATARRSPGAVLPRQISPHPTAKSPPVEPPPAGRSAPGRFRPASSSRDNAEADGREGDTQFAGYRPLTRPALVRPQWKSLVGAAKRKRPIPERIGFPMYRFFHGIAPGSMPPRKRLPITRSAPARSSFTNKSRLPKS